MGSDLLLVVVIATAHVTSGAVMGSGVGALLIGLAGLAIAIGLFLATHRRDPVTAETV